jgi:sensor histidine kinase YesM
MRKIVLTVLFTFSLNLYSQSTKISNAISKCENLNSKIENEQDESIWIKQNQELKKIVLSNINNLYLSTKDKNEFLKYYSITFLNDGAYQTLISNYEKSILLYKKSFSIAKRINHYSGCASSLQNIGTSFDYLGKIDSSLVYFNKALQFAYKSKDETTIAYVLTDLGYVNNNLGNSKVAIDNNLKALKLFTKLKDDEGLERTNFAIGRIFDQLKDYDKSQEYYENALQISVKTNNEQRQCLNLNSIANILFIQKKYNEAIIELNKCLSLCKKNGYKSISGVSYNLLGDIGLETNKIIVAKENYEIANIIFKEDKNDLFHSKTLQKLAEINLTENQSQKAEKLALESYYLCKKNNYPSEIIAISDLLSKIYSKQNNFKNAFKFNTIASRIKDSIYYDENKNTALKAEYKYKSSLKESQIKALSQQKKIADLESQRQKTIVFVLMITIISILITSFVLFNRYKIKKQNELLKSQLIEAEKTIEAEKKATESELKALKSQMNPHFIFNALSSIQDQFMFGDKVIANEQMGNFTYLTRQILNVSGKKSILIATEIDILSKYLELEKMRFKNDFSYSITTSDAIDEDYHEIPPMLIQPFVENSIKHGLMHKNGLKTISINFDLDENEEYIICTIVDNGIGRTKSAEIKAKNQSKHQSFSTESIAQRLELLNENHSIKQLITYSDELENNEIVGTKVVVNIPLG